MVTIREASGQAAEVIRSLHLSAFAEGEGEVVSNLAVQLLWVESAPPTLSLVAETDGRVVGHVAFSPVTTKDGKGFLGYLLAPLAVAPDYQRQGIGSRLIERGRQRLSEVRAGILLVYGDPKYYGRFGFRGAAARAYIPPYPLQYPLGWLGVDLGGGGAQRSPVRIACVAPLCDPVLW